MQPEEIADQLVAGATCGAQDAGTKAPRSTGYYTIFVDTPDSLPPPFGELLRKRETKLIYIGIATSSLLGRLAEEDLRHKGPSTFFRGIGAILGYRPPVGSLLGRSNQNNYRFSAPDTASVIRWIDAHLSVAWLEARPALETSEAFAIRKYRPLINTKHNPEPEPELAALRAECRQIALASR